MSHENRQDCVSNVQQSESGIARRDSYLDSFSYFAISVTAELFTLCIVFSLYRGSFSAINFTTTKLLNIVRFNEDFVISRSSLNRGSTVTHELCDYYLYFYTETLESSFSIVKAGI